MEGITNLLRLNSAITTENCIILELEIFKDKTSLFTFSNFIDPNSNRLTSLFKNSDAEKFELKIFGNSVSSFYESIKTRYAGGKAFYIEFENNNRIMRFWEYSELECGQNDMEDIHFESLEIKECK